MGLVHCVMLFSLSEFKDLKGSWNGFGSGKSYASLSVPFLSLFSWESLNEFKSKTHPFSATIIVTSKMKYALENNTLRVTRENNYVGFPQEAVNTNVALRNNLSDLLFLQVRCKYQHFNFPIYLLV